MLQRNTRFERDACATNTRRFSRLKYGLDSDGTCEPFRWSFGGRLRTNSLYLHVVSINSQPFPTGRMETPLTPLEFARPRARFIPTVSP